ncbi:universal stress protein [Natronobacterium gregoryi]|uniref:Universal stress protein n=2 Tax=Natronobacterium gregoryi TaxID=44930 RepID=L0ALM2_NATGS|nr:universal stress protein [Natronobacterium gregoryi]AFZ74793.1 universal stress protein UspA-like protein [Natronobacterium gregoryi SP2]ELY66124.1 universal stress protein [Natronobacterium gregoryi SP2]PLK19499.1 universal stress protein [Natronobacterium gregoryi SP2]SFJ43269.1 Nucleotide-binding universal stress protein, UspA family [Natronobacterium gregoryi]
MYDTVFAPTDGSDRSETALAHALDLADRYDATLHTQYVVESSPAFGSTLDDDAEEDIYGSLFDAGERAVDDVVDRAEESGLEVESSVVRGVPHEEILEYVDENDVDIVVMATSGRTGTSRELIGSVAERVIRSSPVPVVTVNVGDE